MVSVMNDQPQAQTPAGQAVSSLSSNTPCATCPKPLLAAEKLLLTVFIFFVILTVFLIILQSRWYYATLALSLVVLLVTYKEGLVAMEEE